MEPAYRRCAPFGMGMKRNNSENRSEPANVKYPEIGIAQDFKPCTFAKNSKQILLFINASAEERHTRPHIDGRPAAFQAEWIFQDFHARNR